MLSSVVAAVPQPPTDMVMSDAQGWFTAFIFLPLGLALALAVRNVVRGSGPVLLLCILGGAVAAVFEPIVDVLGLVYLPERGQWTAFETMGRSMPWLIVFVYPWYVGGQGYLAYRLFERGMDRRGVFQLWLIFVGVNIALETPGLLADVYTYYGKQPFNIWGFPLWWGVVNSVMPLAAGALLFKLLPRLGSSLGLVGIVMLVPMADGLVNGALAWPVWATLNSDLGFAATYPAALLTLGLALFAVWMISFAVTSDSDAEEWAGAASVPAGT